MPRFTRREILKLAGSAVIASTCNAALSKPADTGDELRDAEPLVLWYREPAKEWVEALPVGNGRLGAMVFGGIEKDLIQLNEATLWSGGPSNWNNPKAREVLPEVRRAIFAGDFELAEKFCHQMQGPYNQSYQPLGDLHLEFNHSAPVEFYERSLDLIRAV